MDQLKASKGHMDSLASYNVSINDTSKQGHPGHTQSKQDPIVSREMSSEFILIDTKFGTPNDHLSLRNSTIIPQTDDKSKAKPNWR